ncbi:hypothetical protein TOTORO_01990 [Serratia phage vB_SmaS-Totoro]|nr:hypothetical protein TOTORO_01990 [Serratia phage vB_SmaS-Totoro]
MQTRAMSFNEAYNMLADTYLKRGIDITRTIKCNCAHCGEVHDRLATVPLTGNEICFQCTYRKLTEAK